MDFERTLFEKKNFELSFSFKFPSKFEGSLICLNSQLDGMGIEGKNLFQRNVIQIINLVPFVFKTFNDLNY
jgi:hypothetical protein